MNLLGNFKKISLIILILTSQDAISGIGNLLDGISSAVEKKLSENGVKPYIIPLDQGRLIDNERFQEIDIGLSKEQVIYLLGKPPLESPFIDNQWNYIYFNNSDTKKQKILSIHFKNEKVFEILINNKTIKRLNFEKISHTSLDDAPLSDKDKNLHEKHSHLIKPMQTTYIYIAQVPIQTHIYNPSNGTKMPMCPHNRSGGTLAF